MEKEKQVLTGYDKFINWKLFVIPLGLLLFMVFIPIPRSMLDVGVEYSMGPRFVRDFFGEQLFEKKTDELNQWQIQTVRMMEKSVAMSAFSQKAFLKKGASWCEKNGVSTADRHLKAVQEFVGAMSPEAFKALMIQGHELRTQKLTMDRLDDKQKQSALKAGFKLKVAVGIILFVVLCFLTEAIPLPIVSLCTGIIALMAGIVNRETVAEMYWSDATWFIMGSLMFAAAFVKTGVDRRIAMMMFGKLKNPSLKWITFIMILIISPLTMFMSDHALAAMFLPIGITMYSTACIARGKEDPELAKMLMITIAMACNLGGSLAPSGAARNIIMMSYAEDMFGVSIGFGQWMLYCVPFLLFVMPLTWFLVNWRFKPEVTDLSHSVEVVRREIARQGGGKWTRQQKISLVIFLVTLFSWVTENNLIYQLTGIRFGIGVLAVMGAVAYVLAGVVNWRDYQTRVDWGVVWLYAGAIIFGRVLVETGAAYWLARTIMEIMVPLGLGTGLGVLLSGNLITGILTQLMADGPACAAVGPVTLAMAGIAHPGTSMIPFVAMSTAIASSLAYCLVIGTPPNAIVYASGYLEAKDFLRVGVILWFTNMAVLMLMAATYWRWMGWAGLPSF